jgi:hypothetical protein
MLNCWLICLLASLMLDSWNAFSLVSLLEACFLACWRVACWLAGLLSFLLFCLLSSMLDSSLAFLLDTFLPKFVSSLLHCYFPPILFASLLTSLLLDRLFLTYCLFFVAFLPVDCLFSNLLGGFKLACWLYCRLLAG